MAIALWLVMVVLYDLALLGFLLADSAHAISEQLLAGLMLLNPADAFRVFNLTQTGDVGSVAGMGGLGAASGLPSYAGLAAMAVWAAVAGLLAYIRFGANDP